MKDIRIWIVLATILCINVATAQDDYRNDKFRQLEEELPTPNIYRTASGAPGHKYWQQQADYVISLELNDDNQRLYGEETITYTNNSPDALPYLWLQMDQNQQAKDSDTHKTESQKISPQFSTQSLEELTPTFDGGFKLDFVKDIKGNNLPYTVVKTMMRVDLPTPLLPGQKYSFRIKWWFNIPNHVLDRLRGGYEYFPEEDNYIYIMAQWYPRMAVYTDYTGWQHKQFLGRGEFTLNFGNYDVSITVPSDHYVSATGVLQNPVDVLSKTEFSRWEQAKKERNTPVMIVTPEEAKANEKDKSSTKKTWKFKAENVRDFAFASSRKFIWDAMGVPMSDGRVVVAASMYPNESNPLWGQYSTKSVAHTIKWYSHYTFDYPYPIAWSIYSYNQGMEYPMICFNGYRTEEDGTYSERTKYGLISVIIHEVGHNWFPMIVNSDERQWTWMDEGLNSFMQYLAEQQWDVNYPSRRGPVYKMTDYMRAAKTEQNPIMTNSEQIIRFGDNAYGKPATALNVLRETVMGRELFDYAFKTYSNRWKFKHPSPADFFRTMEDASAIDLDWFWWGWFYTNDAVDIAIDDVQVYRVNTKNPEVEKSLARKEREKAPKYITDIRNQTAIPQSQIDKDPSLKDFYNSYDPLNVTEMDKAAYERNKASMSEEEKKILESGKQYVQIQFKNIGGLVMPLIVKLEFTDGTHEEHRIPAEVWRMNNEVCNKVFPISKELAKVVLDPYLETADIDTENNVFPPQQSLSRFDLYKYTGSGGTNPMQQQARKNGTQGSGQ